MTLYGEEILSPERLNPLSKLSQPTSDGYTLIDTTIGYYLTRKYEADYTGQTFICKATGEYLDLIGSIYGVTRLENETDTSYRTRIINTINFVLSPSELTDLGAETYCYIEEIDTQITSKNLLLSRDYLIYADEVIKPVIQHYLNTDTYKWLEEL